MFSHFESFQSMSFNEKVYKVGPNSGSMWPKGRGKCKSGKLKLNVKCFFVFLELSFLSGFSFSYDSFGLQELLMVIF